MQTKSQVLAEFIQSTGSVVDAHLRFLVEAGGGAARSSSRVKLTHHYMPRPPKSAQCAADSGNHLSMNIAAVDFAKFDCHHVPLTRYFEEGQRESATGIAW